MQFYTWALCAASVSLTQAGLPLDMIMLEGPNRQNVDLKCCTSTAHIQEILTLSELPLDRLLRVKIAMHPTDRLGKPAINNQQESEEALPQAEPLKSRSGYRERHRRPTPIAATQQRTDIASDGYTSGGVKQSKLATGFQLTITVLSFLAFGAYLISLVVSIVRNQSATTTATTQAPFILVPSQAGKKRRRRSYNDWDPPNLPDPDNIFNSITKAAEAYARFEGHKLESF